MGCPRFFIRYDGQMEKFGLSEGKKSSTYLDQIDGNNHEKSKEIIQYMSAGLLPKINGETRLLEIGIGSGGSIEHIKREIKDPKLIIYGVDILEPLARRIHEPERNVLATIGDLSRLPLSEKGISAINLSSVLHEGISYHQPILDGRLDIDDFLKQIFSSLIRILAVGGLLMYRDPGLPANQREEREYKYFDVVADFVAGFHDDFITTYSGITKDGKLPQLLFENRTIRLSATVHYHREIQRHLITYLDLALRQISNLSLREILRRYRIGNIAHHELMGVLNSAVSNKLLYHNWLKREGREVYTYRSLNEMTELLANIKEEGIDFKLLEAKEIERVEYSELLQVVSNTDLKDTKQSLLIKRIT